jgi:hypothetical protein
MTKDIKVILNSFFHACSGSALYEMVPKITNPVNPQKIMAAV